MNKDPLHIEMSEKCCSICTWKSKFLSCRLEKSTEIERIGICCWEIVHFSPAPTQNPIWLPHIKCTDICNSSFTHFWWFLSEIAPHRIYVETSTVTGCIAKSRPLTWLSWQLRIYEVLDSQIQLNCALFTTLVPNPAVSMCSFAFYGFKQCRDVLSITSGV